MPLKPSPPGWPRITSALYYQDAAAAIDFLTSAFGFSVRLRVEGDNGSIIHSELEYGDAVIMVSSERGEEEPDDWKRFMRSPHSLGNANTQSLMVYVDDVDAHCAHAQANGAVVASGPTTTDYGDDYWCDRGYTAIDPGGHRWFIAQRLRTPPA